MTRKSKPVRKIPCDVYSRIVGYIRPVRNWHKAKRQEFKDRKTFSLEKAVRECEEADRGGGAVP